MIFFDFELNLKWEYQFCADSFANLILENNYEVAKDYVAIIDWCGVKHYFNEAGFFKSEVTPFDCYKKK